jgi:hypothetical protein
MDSAVGKEGLCGVIIFAKPAKTGTLPVWRAEPREKICLSSGTNRY